MKLLVTLVRGKSLGKRSFCLRRCKCVEKAIIVRKLDAKKSFAEYMLR